MGIFVKIGLRLLALSCCYFFPFIECFKDHICGLKVKIGGMQLFHSGSLWKKLGDAAFGLWCGIDS
jgi:hypothetical protein